MAPATASERGPKSGHQLHIPPVFNAKTIVAQYKCISLQTDNAARKKKIQVQNRIETN